MAKIRIKTSQPWKVSKNRNKEGVAGRSSLSRSRNKTGGGSNPTRSKLNRNKSGSHLDPTLKGGTPDRLRRSGPETPDIAFTPSRVKRGSAKIPQVKSAEPSKRSLKQGG